ncbi:MAG: hypothetical protein PF508_12185, partial [Spirochaeta sp.]|nr:hypothetical protein [Spirochaeta sp.]
METPRTEIPDPSHHRAAWRSLNGPWEFATDDHEPIRPHGERATGPHPGLPAQFHQTITVPFCPQSERSGIGLSGDHPVLWYRKRFSLSDSETRGRVFLTFGAVDFVGTLWVNGTYAGAHRGGYTPIRTEISAMVSPGDN